MPCCTANSVCACDSYPRGDIPVWVVDALAAAGIEVTTTLAQPAAPVA